MSVKKLILMPCDKQNYCDKETARWDWENGKCFKVLGINYVFNCNDIENVRGDYDKILLVWDISKKPIEI